jgi:hypothetical protein
MSNPLPSDVHVNTPLTNISIAYMQKAEGFVADRVFPNIPVLKQSDVYFEYSRADFNRDTMKDRAPSTESAGDGWRVDKTKTYFARPKALHKDIDEQLRANADSPINLDREASLFLSQKAMINREVSWAAAYFTTGLWKGINNAAQDITGVSASPSSDYTVLQWNDANATPVTDVKENNDKIHLTTGTRGNKLVLGRQVWTPLSDHATITDRIKYSSSNTTPAIITKQAVAALMEIDEIMVMDAVQNTGAESNSSTLNTGESNAFIGGKAALLVYAAPSPSIMQPSAGYTFSWTGYLGAGAMGQRITSFYMQAIKSDRVEIEQAIDQKLVAAELGIYFDQIVA